MSIRSAPVSRLTSTVTVMTRLAVVLAGCALVTPAMAAELAFNDGGIGVKVKGMGDFTVSYPDLQPGDRKVVQKQVSGQHAELTYPNDTGVTMDIVACGTAATAPTGAASSWCPEPDRTTPVFATFDGRSCVSWAM